MDHCHIDEEEIANSPYLRLIRDSPAPATLFDAIANDGQVLPPNPKPVSFIVSTSNWDVLHLRVLHVHCLNDLPLSRIFPQAYAIPVESDVALRVQNLFALSKDKVKSGFFDAAEQTNPFYSELSFLLRTNQKTLLLPLESTTRQNMMLSRPHSIVAPPDTILASSFGDSTSGSMFSYGSSGDPTDPSLGDNSNDTTEVVTNNMIVAFLSILSNVAYPMKNPPQCRPEFNAKPDNFTLILMGASLTSINDGSGWKIRFSKTYNQWVRTGGAPLITLEVQLLTFTAELIN